MALILLALTAALQTPAELAGAERILRELALPGDAVVADVGAGAGWLGLAFAQCLPDGRVILEDVLPSWDSALDEAPPELRERVTAIAGDARDPRLPAEGVDLVVLRDALHEFEHPAEMLAGISTGLRPGGFLVVVDRYAGAVRDRTPFRERGAHHAFSAETTTARLAFDAGLAFHARSDERLGFDRAGAFTTIFRKPASAEGRTAPLSARLVLELLREHLGAHGDEAARAQLVLLVAHDPSRDAAVEALRQAAGRGAERAAAPIALEVLELDLDEWRVPGTSQRAPPTTLPWDVVPTFAGVPERPLPALDAAVFVNSFHALIYDDVLLRLVAGALREDAPLLVLERDGEPGWSRLEAFHRRALDRGEAEARLARAGFRAAATRAQPEGAYALLSRAPAAPPPPATLLTSEAWARVLAELPTYGPTTILGDDAGLTDEVLRGARLMVRERSTIHAWAGIEGNATLPEGEVLVTPFPFTGSADCVSASGPAAQPNFPIAIVPALERLPDPPRPGRSDCWVIVASAGTRPEVAFAAFPGLGRGTGSWSIRRVEDPGAPGRAIWILALE